MGIVSWFKKIKEGYAKNRKLHEDHEAFDMPLYEWAAGDYHEHQRGLIWLIAIIAFFSFMVWYAIKTASVTMAVASILLAAIYYITHKNEEDQVHIKISRAGIKVNNKIYPYSRIKAFWIIYHPPFVKTLSFRLYRGGNKEISLQLGHADQEYIRKLLLEYLPEWEGKEESLTEIFSRAFKL